MREIAISSQTYQLCVVERNEAGECTARELSVEDIAQLSQREQALVASLQQQAAAMRELAIIQAQATQEMEKLQYLCDAEREWRHEIKQWIMQGWGYKPKLNPAASKPLRAKTHWHRTRSFCVRKGYH